MLYKKSSCIVVVDVDAAVAAADDVVAAADAVVLAAAAFYFMLPSVFKTNFACSIVVVVVDVANPRHIFRWGCLYIRT